MTVNDSPWPEGVPAWADITVPDLAAAQRFYGGLLGWEFSEGRPETGGYVTASVDGRRVAGLLPAEGAAADAPAAWCVYLGVEDVTLATGHAVAAGAQLLAGPMTVLGLGDIAVLADPAGAVFGLWQSGTHTGWDVTDVPGAFVWAEQMSQQPDLSRRFYVDLFGYEATDMSAPDFTYTSLAVGGTPAVGVGGYGAGVGADVPAAWTWYVAVTDAEDAARRVPEVGGTVVSGPEDTPYGRLVLAQGPAGELVALLEQAPPEVVA